MLTRRSFVKKTLVGTAAVGLSYIPYLPANLPAQGLWQVGAWAQAGDLPGESIPFLSGKDIVKLTILHTNDLHSRIEPFPEDTPKYGGMGGMARRAAIIKKIREQQPNVLLFDAGDIFQGTPYFNYFGGELEFRLMSEMGYDAAVPGNHEFDNGLEGLAKQLPHAAFPFLIANYDFSKTILKDKFHPYRIFEKRDVRVGVFGLGIELKGLVNEKLYGKTIYLDPIDAAKEMVQELKRKRCDLIICLSHLGYKYGSDKISDQVIAQKVEGIDLIIGGHTHTFLDKPTVMQSPSGKNVLINQAGWAGIKIGRIDYVFQKRSKNKTPKGSVLNVIKK
ncbi:MAG: twin-arginine translocation signal domain-containing protein [Cytophagales bacterium]|nr:twin-arginine translocation signal domain-containing protein [Cytophagales bacterium]